MKDEKLTQIFFKALQGNAKLASFDEWHKAGDFACDMRFFPHALACYQRAAEIARNEMTLTKINDLIDKITNVLEFVPPRLKPLIEDMRLSNPLDPAKWLHIANSLLKELTTILEQPQKKLDPEFFSACRFTLAFAAYVSARSGADVEPINAVLADLSDKVNIETLQNRKIQLKDLTNKEDIKVVLLGDQISCGLQPDFELRYKEAYPSLWSKHSKIKISLANNAVCGAGVLDLALYLGRDAIYYKPDLALINFGANDIWLGPSIVPAYEILMEECIKLLYINQIKVILITPTPHIPSAYPAAERPNTISDAEADITPLVDACKRVSIRTGCPLINAAAKFPSNEAALKKLFSNGYNLLNAAGQKLIEEALSESIQT